ncbi:hypothetical protein PFISCL1PPCAC_24544, partial [Pristionchus fissidentatus]
WSILHRPTVSLIRSFFLQSAKSKISRWFFILIKFFNGVEGIYFFLFAYFAFSCSTIPIAPRGWKGYRSILHSFLSLQFATIIISIHCLYFGLLYAVLWSMVEFRVGGAKLGVGVSSLLLLPLLLILVMAELALENIMWPKFTE